MYKKAIMFNQKLRKEIWNIWKENKTEVSEVLYNNIKYTGNNIQEIIYRKFNKVQHILITPLIYIKKNIYILDLFFFEIYLLIYIYIIFSKLFLFLSCSMICVKEIIIYRK